MGRGGPGAQETGWEVWEEGYEDEEWEDSDYLLWGDEPIPPEDIDDDPR